VNGTDGGEQTQVSEAPHPGGVDARSYRDAVSRFPTGVVVVTSRDTGANGDGQHHAMTVSSFTSVSLEPVMVLVSINRKARLHDTMRETDRWGVSVLAAGQEHVSRIFARSDRLVGEGLDSVPHHTGPLTGVVLLDAVAATFECRTAAVYDGGDHSLFLGEVLALDLPRPDLAPLVYYAGTYHTL